MRTLVVLSVYGGLSQVANVLLSEDWQSALVLHVVI